MLLAVCKQSTTNVRCCVVQKYSSVGGVQPVVVTLKRPTNTSGICLGCSEHQFFRKRLLASGKEFHRCRESKDSLFLRVWCFGVQRSNVLSCYCCLSFFMSFFLNLVVVLSVPRWTGCVMRCVAVRCEKPASSSCPSPVVMNTFREAARKIASPLLYCIYNTCAADK